MPQLNSVQLARARTLLYRLKHLEDAAAVRTDWLNQSLTPEEQFFRKAKALDARLFRLELASSFGESIHEFDELESRLGFLERGIVRINDPQAYPSVNVQRVAVSLDSRNLKAGYMFLRVPDGKRYYSSMSLEERSTLLGAPSAAHLCKTLLFSTSGGRFDDGPSSTGEKTSVQTTADEKDQFVLLVVPYNSKVDASKLRVALKAKNLLQSRKSSPCLASPGRAERVLGFPHNGVCVVGGASQLAQNIPIVFAEVLSKLTPPCVYMGGGEPDIKLCVGDVHELIAATGALVLDVTEPRSKDELDNGSEESTESTFATDEGAKPSAIASLSSPITTEPPHPVSTLKTDSAQVPPENKKRSAKEKKDGSAPPPDSDDESNKKSNVPIDFDDLDVRVGLIQAARCHPNSQKLMCETIDIGESGGPRPIVSGIQEWYSPEALVGQRVCIVANLKAATLGGEKSEGMVLCASWASDGKNTVRIVEPPTEAPVGARLSVATALPLKTPATSTTVKKKKIFEVVAEKLCLDSDGQTVVWDGRSVGYLHEGRVIPCKVPNGVAGAKVS